MNPWIRKAIVALIGLAGVAGVGLWYTCGVQPHEAVFLEDPKYSAHWELSRLPLGVRDAEFTADTKAAVDFWNDWVGCKLFVMDGGNADVKFLHVGITVGDEEQRSIVEGTYVSKTGAYVNYALVNLYEPVFDLQFEVNAHALGHVLGLAHDRHCIMQPIQKSSTKFKCVSDKDKAALKERYCE